MPATSDAEIRAFLRPLLKAGKPPTYKAMRATLGGGFSRLARIKKQVERELAGGDVAARPANEPVGAAELVATLEALFDRQWKAIEEWERRSLAWIDVVPSSSRPPAAKATGVADASSVQADRLEAVERRLLAMLDKLQAMTTAPAAPPARMPAVAAPLEAVPPAWARQAAAAATAALEGRLQSMEETMRDAAVGGRAAFDLAAGIAREVAVDASLQLQIARSTLSKAMREEFGNSERSALLHGVHQAVGELRGQVVKGFTAAAAVADRRAVGIRDAIIAMVDIEVAQVEMLAAVKSPVGTRLKIRHKASNHGLRLRGRGATRRSRS